MAPALRFPDGFLWGAAISAHQTEGFNTNSDWWRAEQQGSVPYRSGPACEWWERYDEDVRLARQLGLRALRLSVEWARIEPEPGRFDRAVLDHYRRVLGSLHEAGIEPLVTLHHTTNPRWLADRGAWTSPDVVPLFARYADRVADALGDLVTWWVTINEPTVAGIFGYLTGLWPPHRQNAFAAYLRHAWHCLRGHNAAREALRARHPHALASMAMHLNPLDPVRRGDPTDWLAVHLYDWLWQGLFLQAAAPSLDWVGVNYYFRLFVKWDLTTWNRFIPPKMGRGRKTEYRWEIYPEGLYRVLRRVGHFRKPVLVTENGIADHDDDQRPAFLVEHLRQAQRAIKHGVDLRGYCHWSLLDNFEWTEGYTQRFGLAEVDFATQRRAPRPSAELYRSIIQANAIEPRHVVIAHERRAAAGPPPAVPVPGRGTTRRAA